MIKFYISEGANVDNPPSQVGPIPPDSKIVETYRRTPYLIQCAMVQDESSLEMFMEFAAAGCTFAETGFICFSRLRGNLVTSNIVGAAAYWGNLPILNFILSKLKDDYIDVKALETGDAKKDKKAGSSGEEFLGMTPL